MKRIFGRDVSFPYDWTKPGELQYEFGGLELAKGWWPWVLVRAWVRRYILHRRPVFWMPKCSHIESR